MLTATRYRLTCLAIAICIASSSAHAQQPSTEALAAAQLMVAASQAIAAGPETFRPLVLGALENIAEAKDLPVPTKNEIAEAASIATVSKLPINSSKLTPLFAFDMSIDDMKAVTAFFSGDVPKRMLAAQAKMSAARSSMQIEPGKQPAVIEEFAEAADGMMAFFGTPAGKSYMQAQLKHVAVMQEIQSQWLMQAATTLNDEVRSELRRRGHLK